MQERPDEKPEVWTSQCHWLDHALFLLLFLFSKVMSVVFISYFIQDRIVCWKGLWFVKTWIKVMLFWHVCCVTVAGLFTIPELQLLICGKSVLQPVSWSHGEAHTGHCEDTWKHYVYYQCCRFARVLATTNRRVHTWPWCSLSLTSRFLLSIWAIYSEIQCHQRGFHVIPPLGVPYSIVHD